MAIEIMGGATFTSEIAEKFPRGGDKRPTEIELVNRTAARIVLHEDASHCQVSTAGAVEDKDKNNTVKPLDR